MFTIQFASIKGLIAALWRMYLCLWVGKRRSDPGKNVGDLPRIGIIKMPTLEN